MFYALDYLENILHMQMVKYPYVQNFSFKRREKKGAKVQNKHNVFDVKLKDILAGNTSGFKMQKLWNFSQMVTIMKKPVRQQNGDFACSILHIFNQIKPSVFLELFHQ